MLRLSYLVLGFSHKIPVTNPSSSGPSSLLPVHLSAVLTLTSGSESLHCIEDAFLVLSKVKARHGAVVLIPGTEIVLSGAWVFPPGAGGIVSRTKALTYNARALL